MSVYTEEEAKTKWCPFVQRDYGIYPETRRSTVQCIASACMAWRQAQSRCIAEQSLPEDQQPVGASHDEARAAGWVDAYSVGYPRHWSKYEPQGYCGLAGTP